MSVDSSALATQQLGISDALLSLNEIRVEALSSNSQAVSLGLSTVNSKLVNSDLTNEYESVQPTANGLRLASVGGKRIADSYNTTRRACYILYAGVRSDTRSLKDLVSTTIIGSYTSESTIVSNAIKNAETKRGISTTMVVNTELESAPSEMYKPMTDMLTHVVQQGRNIKAQGPGYNPMRYVGTSNLVFGDGTNFAAANSYVMLDPGNKQIGITMVEAAYTARVSNGTFTVAEDCVMKVTGYTIPLYGTSIAGGAAIAISPVNRVLGDGATIQINNVTDATIIDFRVTDVSSSVAKGGVNYPLVRFEGIAPLFAGKVYNFGKSPTASYLVTYTTINYEFRISPSSTYSSLDTLLLTGGFRGAEVVDPDKKIRMIFRRFLDYEAYRRITVPMVNSLVQDPSFSLLIPYTALTTPTRFEFLRYFNACCMNLEWWFTGPFLMPYLGVDISVDIPTMFRAWINRLHDSSWILSSDYDFNLAFNTL